MFFHLCAFYCCWSLWFTANKLVKTFLLFHFFVKYMCATIFAFKLLHAIRRRVHIYREDFFFQFHIAIISTFSLFIEFFVGNENYRKSCQCRAAFSFEIEFTMDKFWSQKIGNMKRLKFKDSAIELLTSEFPCNKIPSHPKKTTL